MKTIELDGKTYNILDKSLGTDFHDDIDYESLKTDTTKENTVFIWFPTCIDEKWVFMKKVKVIERLYLNRWRQFDDGWSYSFYWGPWKEEWKYEKIL